MAQRIGLILNLKDNFIKKYQTIPFTYPAPNPNSSVDSKVSAIIDRGADIIITFAGNISEFSNIEDLFEIERVAKYKNLNFQIIVCGSGPKYEYFANKSKSQKAILFLRDFLTNLLFHIFYQIQITDFLDTMLNILLRASLTKL